MTRVTEILWKYRCALLALWLVHAFVIHYWLLGFPSWDGFGHRGGPLVELFQHGDMNKWKSNEWSLRGYTPFIELAHLPFLAVFGMRGFIIGFPLVVFPLCVAAVYLLVRELSGGDERAGFFGCLAYAAIPMINQQPFTNYVDFAVAGLLAFWLYAMVCLRRDERLARKLGRLAIATLLFSLGRSQALYMMIIMVPLIMYGAFGEREGWRIRLRDMKLVALATGVLALASIPTIALQIYKYLEYGSPIAPMQFKFLGLKIGTGVPLETYFRYAGLGGTDLASVARGAFDGWVYRLSWPMPMFYSSTYFAAGFLFVLALVLLPFYLRRASRVERWILGAGLVVSLLAKDIAVPRTSYTTIIALAIVLGRSIPMLAEWKRWSSWLVVAIVALHLLRPELDIVQAVQGRIITPRMNIASSRHYIKSPWNVRLYADRGYRFVIIGQPQNGFVLPLYGKRLRNEVLTTVSVYTVGPRCVGLRYWTFLDPNVLFIDDFDVTKECRRTCVLSGSGQCGAWKIDVP